MSKKIVNNTYSFLSNLYQFEYKNTNELDWDLEVMQQYRSLDLSSSKYALCIYRDHKQLIGVAFFTSDDTVDYNERFQYFLQFVEIVHIDSISILLAYMIHCDGNFHDNPFKIREKYPSDFAKNILSNTYGYLLYKFQLAQLLRASLPFDSEDVDRIIKSINHKRISIYEEMKKVILPDNYNLYDLLRDYTPLGKENGGVGFVITPDYRLVYNFYKSIMNDIDSN
jgi:hypothetical protein